MVILIPSVFFLLIGNAFANSGPIKEWYEWEQKQNVPRDKTWSITFNQEIDESSIHSGSIFIENSQLDKIENEIRLDESGRVILIEPPADEYQSDETYTLYITNELSSKSNNLLKQPVKMRFTTVSEIPPGEDSDNTIEIAAAVKEVDESSVQSVTDSTVQIEGEGAQQLEKGDVLLLPESEEYPNGLAVKLNELTEGNGVQAWSYTLPEIQEIVKEMDIDKTVPLSSANIVPLEGVEMVVEEETHPRFTTQSVVDEKIKFGPDIIFKFNKELYERDASSGETSLTFTGDLKLISPTIHAKVKFDDLFLEHGVSLSRQNRKQISY